MKVVIQCAGSKRPGGNSLRTNRGQRVRFVAHPEMSQPIRDEVLARPDDLSDESALSWRDILTRYNSRPGDNSLRLLRAYELYEPKIYRLLASRVGLEKLYILSAGWGLVAASYLLPDYDITFSKAAGRKVGMHIVRQSKDAFLDYRHIPREDEEPICFFGGLDYLGLFAVLTDACRCEKTVFYKSESAPSHAAWRTIRFQTARRTNWHYECAQAFAERQLKI